MSLSSQLIHDFPSYLRTRGQHYFTSGRVRITSASATELRATVRGGETYHVSLEYQDSVLAMSCTCPFFESDGPCKHLWATVLAADVQGHLSQAARARNLVAVEEDPAGEWDEDIDAAPARPVPAPKPPAWQTCLFEIAQARTSAAYTAAWPERREVLYVIDVPGSKSANCLALELWTRERKANGEGWNKSKELRLRRQDLAKVPDPADRHILSLVAGGENSYGFYGMAGNGELSARQAIVSPLSDTLLPLLCATGRCLLRLVNGSHDLHPLSWDEGAPWEFGLEVARNGQGWRLDGMLSRGEARVGVSVPELLLDGGLVFMGGRASRLSPAAPFDWISQLRRRGSIPAAAGEEEHLLAALLQAPGLPPLTVPEELRFEEVRATPKMRLTIRTAPERAAAERDRLNGRLTFVYDSHEIPSHDNARGFFDGAARRLVVRDSAAEAAASQRLRDFGARLTSVYWEDAPVWIIPQKKLPSLVHALLNEGWHVEAEGKVFRRPGAFRLGVSSGIDWFELHGEVEYGDTTVSLPELLAAARRGDGMVRLGDGVYGVLPEDWLKKLGPLVDMGAALGDHVRFRRHQAGLLDALLAAQPDAEFDATFARVREELRSFYRVQPAEQPAGFQGQLRGYQREGLGWMEFLRRFGFGGCLADDMGVGKTAQVLALLETRRQEQAGPSLVVVPRSLVFNWREEAARFTPGLRVLDHTGMVRSTSNFANFDLILTTYGTLLRDIPKMRQVEFDYIVLDEAQAVKNAATASAKAVRLLQGRHRLALSGTPVENHLGELWSLMEFLNPGMLGTARVFQNSGGALRNPDEATRRMLAHALRPFILRRTKQQVVSELPEKTEQSIYCELDADQGRLYTELRDHYRATLLHRVETDGMARSKMHVLEALLRLRQAACHPGLVDPKRAGESSAKLEFLLNQLDEVLEEGHKVLVFSQFTSLLAIVRQRLDERGIVYEYLDGGTHDRQARVERFQNDPACPLFLISLKAGGLGLNLTAAEYVFLLDPWWNPAIEAQAIDRTHRIGQTRPVFAYRVIARNTVEEKILELQNSKRDLAAAIIGEDNSLIRNLRREDLEILLS